MEELKNAKNSQEAIWAAIQAIKEYYNVMDKAVAILLYDDEMKALKFVHPPELMEAGAIPPTTSSSIAAKVFMAKDGFLSNDFLNVKHLAFFEKISGKEEPIRKLIAAPIATKEKTLGVLEVSRGNEESNFTSEDLLFLKQIGEILGEKLQELEHERKT